MKRGLLVIAVAVMLVLAGCSGGPGDGTASPGTDASTDSSDSTDPIPSGVGTLDGVNESVGVYNGSAMMAAHFKTLNTNNTHYTETTRLSNDAGSVTFAYTNGTDADSFVFTNETTGESQEYWKGGSTVAMRNQSTTPPVTIAQGDTRLAQNYGFVSAIIRLVPYSALRRTNLSAAGTTTVDGEELYRFTVDGYNNSEAESSLSVFENATAMSGTVLVSSDGTVQTADLTATIEEDGETSTTVMNYSVSAVGTATAPQPDWVADGRQASVSTTSNDKVLTFTPENGDSIPAGTRIEVGGSWTTYGNVTLDEPLESGETLYVVATGGFGDSSATAQVGQQPSVPDDALSMRENSVGLTMVIDGTELQYALPKPEDS